MMKYNDDGHTHDDDCPVCRQHAGEILGVVQAARGAFITAMSPIIFAEGGDEDADIRRTRCLEAGVGVVVALMEFWAEEGLSPSEAQDLLRQTINKVAVVEVLAAGAAEAN